MFRNAKNVGYVMIGQGAIAQLEDVLKPRREAGGPAVWFFDHFFKTGSLAGRLPIEDQDVVVYVDTAEEPTTDGIDAYKAEIAARIGSSSPCALLAFGGGATMDTCKCVGNLLTNPGRAEDYQGWDLVKHPAPYKIGCPTLSGTGSESSRTGVLCNVAKNLKLGMNSDYTMFDQLILDPDLSETVPRNQFFYTGVDTYMHCFESLAGSYRNVVVDALAEKAIDLSRQIFGSGDMMLPENREKLMIASYLGGMAAGFVGVVHPISAGLSMVLGMHHGIANCYALSALADIYPEQHAEVAEWMARQGIDLPKGICRNLTDEQFQQLYGASIVHEKPLAKALGPDFKQILTLEKVTAIYKSM